MRHKGCYWGPILILFVTTSANLAIAQDTTVNGNLLMNDSTTTVGNILKGPDLFIHNFGINNTFIGKNAGNLTLSTDPMDSAAVENTGVGVSALSSLFAGSGNTAIGFRALQNNINGGGNTAFGAGALGSNIGGILNTASGSGALQNNNSHSNTASGALALFSNTDGENNTASGQSALFSNTTGNGNTAIGAGANVSVGNLTNATAIGLQAVVNDSNKVRLGNTNVSVIEGQVPYTFISDRNQKENFQPVDSEAVLAKLAQLSVSSWNYIGQDAKQFRHYGPVAQDFFAAFGHDSIGTIGTDATINSGDVEGILMIAVQALEKRTSELATLKAENADLKARLEKLERSVGTLVVKAE